MVYRERLDLMETMLSGCRGCFLFLSVTNLCLLYPVSLAAQCCDACELNAKLCVRRPQVLCARFYTHS